MKFLFLFILIPFISWSQEAKLEQQTIIDADTFIGIDTYGNSYFIKDLSLFKKGNDGDFVFNDFQLGPIHSVDIINPLKVTLFYKNVNTVVLLDNRLSEVERIDFNSKPDAPNISAARNAGNNLLWIFNENTRQLELYNYRTDSRLVSSQPFEGTIVSIANDFNVCYVLTETQLLSFNSYGSLLSKDSLEGFEHIVRNKRIIIGLKENGLYFIHEKSILPIKLKSTEISIKDLQLSQDFLYIYDGINLSQFILTYPIK